jgi:arylsulfatase A-like enzyme
VDAFVYSPLLPKSSAGTTYPGLMHISDWFPTILDLSGLSYTSIDDYSLDGVSHYSSMVAGGNIRSPRQFMLYNMFYNIDNKNFDILTNAPVAIRDERFKLIHSYIDNKLSNWYDFSKPIENDDEYSSADTCTQTSSLTTGTYTKMLFDLKEDPSETNNLFHDSNYDDIKVSLPISLILIFFKNIY